MAKKKNGLKLVREVCGEDVYEYYPLGKHVVIAPGVCGGRPTFKGTRVEVRVILNWLRVGRSIERVLEGYPSITRAGVEEALALATSALVERYRARAA